MHLISSAVVLVGVCTAGINTEGGADGIGFELRMGRELRRNARDSLLVRREPLCTLLVHVATVGSLVGLLTTQEVEGAATIAVLAVDGALQSGHCGKGEREGVVVVSCRENGGSVNQ
jgi:hypothetical protein